MDRRVLVTGATGFAGRHLVRRLGGAGTAPVGPSRAELDLLDREAVRGMVREAQPEVVYHLAAIASTAHSWDAPTQVVLRNLETTTNLLDAVRTEAPGALVLLASSGQVYGSPRSLPVDESAAVRPLNPYAVSKAACELVASQHVDAHGMRVVCTRAFNHAGPGQSAEYVVGTLTRQVAEAEAAGRREVVLRLGDLDAARDFTDVRDVVRAYELAVELEPGPYNVCSGRSLSALDLVDILRPVAAVEIEVEQDPERLRPSEVRELRGSAARLTAATGWAAEIPLETTVFDALTHWRQTLAAEPALAEPAE